PKRPAYLDARRSIRKYNSTDGLESRPYLSQIRPDNSGRDVSPKRPTSSDGRRSIRKRNSTDGLESRPYLSQIRPDNSGRDVSPKRPTSSDIGGQAANVIRRTAWRAVPT